MLSENYLYLFMFIFGIFIVGVGCEEGVRMAYIKEVHESMYVPLER